MRIGASLLLLALVSIGLTLWVTWQLEGGAAAVNEAGRMRMQTWRLASAVQAGVERAELQALVARFDESLALLREGNPSRPLFVPWDDQVREFQLLTRFRFQLRTLKGKLLIPPAEIVLQRDISFNESAVHSYVSTLDAQRGVVPGL